MSTQPKKAVQTVSVAAVRWSIAAVFIISMGTSFVVAAQGVQRDDDLRRVIAIQETVVAQAHNDNYRMCLAGAKAAQSSNAILDTLIAAVTLTKSIPPAEKTDRVRKYRAIKVQITPCKQ